MNKIKNELYSTVEYKDLKDMLKRVTEKYSNNTAFIVKEKQAEKVIHKNITFKTFEEDTNALGVGLNSIGLQGKRVAVISPNRYEWCTSYLAVANGVGVIIPMDRSLPMEELPTLLMRSKADCLIFDKKYKDDIREMIKNNHALEVKNYICMDDKEDGEFLSFNKIIETGKELINKKDKIAEEYLNCKIDAKKMSILLFTSGTTSASKAVMLSHENIVSELYSLKLVLHATEEDISLSFLPLHHTFGAIAIWFIFITGASTCFCDGLRHIQDNMKEYGVTVLVTVPLLIETMYKRIMKTIEKQGKTKTVEKGRKIANTLSKVHIDVRRKLFKEIIDALGGKLRIIICGAAGLDKDVAKALNEFGIVTCQGYGLTETSPVVCVEPDKYIKYGSVGFPIKNVEIQIENPNEEGIGEMKVKGPIVMQGYYEMPEETNEAIKDGWFYTGDLAHIDKDGYVFIDGRKKNVIVLKNGKNIYPEELETLIAKLPYVAESMVFGYPDGDDSIVSSKIVYDKEYVKENYSSKTTQDLEKMIWEDIKKINTTVAGYQHIKKIIVTDEPMIKTTTAKIKRFEEINKILNNK